MSSNPRDETLTPVYRRRRPALSCEACRRRKVKCDRTRPCNQCTKDSLQCTYKLDPRLSHTQSRAQSSGVSRSQFKPSPVNPANLERESTVLTQETQDVIERQDTTGLIQETSRTNQANVVNNHATEDTSDTALQQLRNRVHALEAKLSKSDSQASMRVASASAGQLSMNLDTNVNKTRLAKSSRWVYKVGQFAICFAFYLEIESSAGDPRFQDPRSRTCIEETRALLHKCKVVARNLKVNRPGRLPPTSKLSLAPADRPLLDGWISMYVRHFESALRIVHVPTFMLDYESFWQDPEKCANGTQWVILLAAAVGSSVSDTRNDDKVTQENVRQWVHAAQLWLAGPLEKDRLNITGIQVHCLLILARLVLSIGGDLLWISAGNLMHTAMQIGLHRDPDHLPPMPLLVAEIRRRLWATILELLLQAALDSEMPARISMDDFDTKPPLTVNDEDINERTVDLSDRAQTSVTGTSLQCILLRCVPTRIKTLRLLNGLDSEMSYADVLALNAELDEHFSEADKIIQRDADSHVTAFRVNFLQCLVRRFILHIHTPFLYSSFMDPMFYYTRKVCTEASMVIISPEPDTAYDRLLSVGGGLFKHSIRYAGCAIALELIAQTSDHVSNPTRFRHSAGTRQALRNATNELLNLCSERVRRGESNVKMHMFLTTVMAEVQAMESGMPSELCVAQSACDSLRCCFETLQDQSSHVDTPNSSAFDTTGLDGQQDFAWDLDLDFFLQDDNFF